MRRIVCVLIALYISDSQRRKQPVAAPLSPIKEPNENAVSLTTMTDSSHTSHPNANAKARRILGIRHDHNENKKGPAKEAQTKDNEKAKHRGRALIDLTNAGSKKANASVDRNKKGDASMERSMNTTNDSTKRSTIVRDRVRDWERERERLREMSRLEDIERERDEELETARRAREVSPHSVTTQSDALPPTPTTPSGGTFSIHISRMSLLTICAYS